MRRGSLVLASSCILFALTGYACGSGGGDSSAGSGGAHATSSGTGAAGGSSSSEGGAGGGLLTHGAVQSLTVSPPSATVDVMNGVASPASFQAIATYEDGFSGPIDANWSIDRIDLGAVSSTGAFTASGKVGGKGTITAKSGPISATASVTVVLHVTDNPANLSQPDQALFDTPDAEPSGTLLYPYDETVFARGLLAPELMWSGGAAGGAYLVHVSDAYFDAKFYTTADPPSAFAIPQAAWDALTTSNEGGPVTLDVLRLSGGQAHAAMHETWTIAQGSLRGTIHYWAVNTGQLMKINPGASSPVTVFDSGPADQLGSPAPANYNGAMPPWESGGGGKRCVACHTVSKDGSTIAAVFEKNGSTASPWGTIDLTQSPPAVTQMTAYDSTAIYLGLTPDGSHAVQNDLNFSMRLRDAKTGAVLPSALDGFADKTADPAFSPDGKLLAFSSNVTGAYPVEFWRADLDVMDYDAATLSFSNRRTIALGGSSALAFPSFSPDSAWVVFQGGDYSRAKYGNGLVGHDDLYIADVAQQVGAIKLDAASGANLDAKNQHISYQPTVNPIAVGGYYWVVFVSPRDYGNKMLSASDPTYQNRKQLWVAAVDANPQPGKDPSHPAFWLPGQDLSTINMSGYWALEPCKQEGGGCNEGYECCTGFCQPDGNGAYACVPPPGKCSEIGEKCDSAADCCGAPQIQCIGGFCSQAQPN